MYISTIGLLSVTIFLSCNNGTHGECEKSKIDSCEDVIEGCQSYENITCDYIEEIHDNPEICFMPCTILFKKSNTFLRTNSFSHLQDVRKIYMHNNEVKSLESRAFSGSIRYLHIEENFIKKIPKDAFFHLNELIFLNLSNNQISEVQEMSFSGCKSLKSVDFSYNKLKDLSSTILDSSLKLQTLNLSHNSIERMNPNWCFHFHWLKYLMFDHNRIIFLEDCSSNKNLEVLSMSHNSLTILNGTYFPKKLKTLNLKSNLIKFLSNDAFQNLNELKVLDLSNNKLNSLPYKLFGNLKNLTHLDLSSNNLMHLNDGVFFGLFGLEFFNLSNINVTHIKTMTFYPMKQILSLDISKNNMVYLDVDSLLHLCKKLEFLRIDGNSFTCPILTEILLKAHSKNVTIPSGQSYNKRSWNGINCSDEEDTSIIEEPNQIQDFFKDGFRKSAFFKFFSSYKHRNDPNLIRDLFKNVSQEFQKEMRSFSAEQKNYRIIDEDLSTKLLKVAEMDKKSSNNEKNFTTEMLSTSDQKNSGALTEENSTLINLESSLNSIKLMFFLCTLIVISFCVIKFYQQFGNYFRDKFTQINSQIPLSEY